MDHFGKLDQVIDYLKRSTGSSEQTNFLSHISSRYSADLLLEKLREHFGTESPSAKSEYKVNDIPRNQSVYY